MKKINSKGFTLIELLAVITIMGILMLVAIPAVSRTIENSRRDTYMDTAKAYLNAVKNAVAADEIKCTIKTGDEFTNASNYVLDDAAKVISAQPAGDYYLPFSSEDNSGTDLLEQGGKSSWGSSNVRGTIKLHKTVDNATGITKYAYSILMIDEGGRGIGPNYVSETQLVRQDVKTSGLNTEFQTAHVGNSTPANTQGDTPVTAVKAAAANICKVVTG